MAPCPHIFSPIFSPFAYARPKPKKKGLRRPGSDRVRGNDPARRRLRQGWQNFAQRADDDSAGARQTAAGR